MWPECCGKPGCCGIELSTCARFVDTWSSKHHRITYPLSRLVHSPGTHRDPSQQWRRTPSPRNWLPPEGMEWRSNPAYQNEHYISSMRPMLIDLRFANTILANWPNNTPGMSSAPTAPSKRTPSVPSFSAFCAAPSGLKNSSTAVTTPAAGATVVRRTMGSIMAARLQLRVSCVLCAATNSLDRETKNDIYLVSWFLKRCCHLATRI